MPGFFVAARKSELGGLWPYLDNHDAKDRTASMAAQDDQEEFQGAGEPGGDEDKEFEGLEEAGEGWEHVLDFDGGGIRRGQTAVRRGRRERDVMFDQEW